MHQKIDLGNNKWLEYYPKDARSIIMLTTGNIDIREEKDSTNRLHRIIFGDYILSIGDTLKCEIYSRSIPYNIRFMQNTGVRGEYMLSTDFLNKSTFFILPALGQDHLYFSRDIYLINAYAGKSEDDIGKVIYTKYLFIPSPKYLKLEEDLKNHPLYTSMANSERNYYHVIFQFVLKDDSNTLRKNIQLVYKGKYSKTTDSYKEKILKFNKVGIGSLIYSILYKTPNLRTELEERLGVTLGDESELCSAPIAEEELLING